MKSFIITAYAVLITQFLFAQKTLNGTTTDKITHEKLRGVFIYSPELNKGTKTNENGEFALTGFGKGEFKLQITYQGYTQTIEKIYISDNDTTIEIKLQKLVVLMNEVVISGAYFTSQDQITQEIDVVNKSEMAKIGASTVMDIISKVSGINAITTGPFVSRPVIRGLSGNRILTVVDGVRFETQQWDDEHGIGINELGMDHVEIIKGPASLLYGPEAMGGVIHFIEEDPAPIGHIIGDIQSSFFTNNHGINAEINVRGATDKHNYSLSALGKSLPDYYFDGSNFRAPNTRLIEFGGRATYGINRKWGSSSISYQFNQAQYGILDGKDIVKNPDGSISNKDTLEKEKYPREVEAPYHSVIDNKITSRSTILAGTSQFKITLGFQNNHRAEFEDNGLKKSYNYLDMTLNSSTYDVKWYLPTCKYFSSIVGAQGMFQINKNASSSKTQLIPDAKINDLGLVALTKYTYKNIIITAGARYDNRNLSTDAAHRDSTVNMLALSKSYSNVSGSIGASYNVMEHLLFKVNFASGYRSPNLNELMSNGVKLESQHYELGNLNFEKEQNNELDMDLRFKSKHFSLEVSAYINNITNFIYLTPTGDSVSSNITNSTVAKYEFFQTNAQIKGGEVRLEIHPQSINWIQYELKGSTLEARRTNNDSYLPMMPADKISNTLLFTFKNSKSYRNIFARVGLETTLAQKKVASNELSTSGYTLLNASFGVTRIIWKWNNIDLTVSINNLLDKVYLDNMSRLRQLGVSNPGRNIAFNVRIPFDYKK